MDKQAPEALQSLLPLLFSMRALRLVDDFPFWMLYSQFKLVDLSEVLQSAAQQVHVLALEGLGSAEPVSLGAILTAAHLCFAEAQKLDTAEEMLTEWLGVLWLALQTPVLERRVSAARALNSLLEHYQSADTSLMPLFISVFRQQELVAALLAPLHCEVLKHCHAVLQWATGHRLLPKSLVPALWSAAVELHESTRTSVSQILVKLSPALSPDLIQSFSHELETTATDLFDAPFLSFLKQFLTKLAANSSSTPFVQQAFAKLSALPHSQAASEILADLMVQPMFIELAAAAFQGHFQAAERTLSSVQFLAVFVEGLRKQQVGLENFVGPPTSQFVDVCLRGLESTVQRPNEELRVKAWLNCIDNAGKLGPEAGRNPYLSPTQFRSLWQTLLNPRSRYQEQFLSFVGSCTSSWLNAAVVRPLVSSVETLQPEVLTALPWLRTLSCAGYEGLFRLLTRTCVDRPDSKVDQYTYTSEEMTGLRLLTLCPIVAENSEVRQASTARLLRFLTCMNLPHICLVVVTFALELAGKVLTSHTLSFISAVFAAEAKYQKSPYHEEDLDQVVSEAIAGSPPWLPLLGVDYVDQLKRQVSSQARKFKVPYFCMGLVEGSATELPRVTVRPYTQPDLRLMNEHLIIFMAAIVGTHNEEAGLQAWLILTQILPRIHTSPSFDKFLQSPDIVTRLIWLQTRQSDCERSKVLDLFNYLEKPSTEVVKFHGFRLVLYVDLLCGLMARLYWERSEALDQVDMVLSLLIATSQYYSEPTALPTLPTNVYKSAETLLTRVSPDILNIHSDQIATLLHSSLCICPVAHIRQSALSLLLTLTSRSRTATFLLSILGQHCSAMLSVQDNAVEFFSLLAKVCASGDPGRVHWAEEVGERCRDKEYFWSLSDQCRAKVLKTLSCVQKSLSDPLKTNLLIAISGVLLDYHPRNVTANKPGSATYEAGLGLLLALLASPHCHSTFVQVNTPVLLEPHWRTRSLKGWKLASKSSTEAGYTGISNLGATCYLAATIQQLRAIPTFSQRLLSLAPSTTTCTALVDLFSRLIYKTNRRPVSPAALVSTLSHRIQLQEQMDIEEFFNFLLHHIDSELNTRQRSSLVEDHFKGRHLTTLVCDGCKNQRPRSEDFLTLTLGIKGKRELLESLTAMVQGELMEGDNAINCEKCGGAQRSYSRQQVQILPKILICSLRRFEYDLVKGLRQKLNDRFAFPHSLDFRPYCTRQDLPSDYYQYRLKGVALHIGLAEAGHYYSIVKEGEKWLKCDDEVVTDYEIAELPKEAFGGGNERSGLNFDPCAYLLLYEREHFYASKSVQVLPVPSPDLCNSQHLQLMDLKLRTRWQLRTLLNPHFPEFVFSLLEVDSPQLLQFALTYFLTVYVRSTAASTSPALLERLASRLEASPQTCNWLLEVLSKAELLDEFLVSCPSLPARKSVALLIASASKSASESAISLAISRFASKISTFPGSRKLKSLACFYESLWKLTARCKQPALDCCLPELLISTLFDITMSEHAFPAPEACLDAGEYLGQPMGEYTQAIGEIAGNEENIGYFLAVLNELITCDLAPWIEVAVGDTAFWAKLDLKTHFECVEMGKFIGNCYDIKAEGVYQLLENWLETGFEPVLSATFDILQSFLEISNCQPLEYALSRISTMKAQPLSLLPHLYRLYRHFPSSETWKSPDFQQFLRTIQQKSAYLDVLQGNTGTFPPVPPSPQSLYDFVPPSYPVQYTLANALILQSSVWLGREENASS